MIVDEHCEKCEEVKRAVTKSLSDNGITAKIRFIKYDTDEAVDLAIVHNLSQVPSMVVNGVGFAGFPNEIVFLVALGKKSGFGKKS
jgi:hypothetical protein